MALAINSTVGDEKANSYVAVAYADDYWANHWNATLSAQWANLDPNPKINLLIQACRVVDTLRFTEPVDPLSDWHLVYDSRTQTIRSLKSNYSRPQKYNYYQHLQFPRTLDVYSDGTIYIPEEIQMAQCEQAMYILNFDDSIIANSLQGVAHDAIGVSGVSISQKLNPNGSMISPTAYQFCKPYLLKGSVKLMRA